MTGAHDTPDQKYATLVESIMKIQLKKFDMRKVSERSVICMIGSRGAGKSVLVRDVLYHHQDIPAGMVISGTEESNEFYSTIVPACFIYNEYKPEFVDKFVKRQKMITKKVRKEEKMFGSSKIDPRGFLILDDCLYDNSWNTDVNIRSVAMNGRHSNCFFIICLQYSLGVLPAIRNNFDYVFILREPRIMSRKRLYENYCGFIPHFEIFNQIMDECTQNYECLVVDNTTKSNNLSDQLFWYKADIHDHFKMCPKEFWMMSQQRAESDDDDDGEELYDVSLLKLNKKTPRINVEKTAF